MFQIQNNSIEDVNPIIDILNQFMPFSQKKLGFHKPVSLFLQSDEENANKILGKTAFYNPAEFSVTVFTTGRHPKDILRSLSHELVHHTQNCRGDFEGDHIAGEGYAQKDPHMRNMELEAYEKGNIIFRDFEDLIKAGKINIKLSGEPKMSLKEWKDNELNTLLMEKWGYRKEDDKAKEDESADEEGNRPSMAKEMDLNEQEAGFDWPEYQAGDPEKERLANILAQARGFEEEWEATKGGFLASSQRARELRIANELENEAALAAYAEELAAQRELGPREGIDTSKKKTVSEGCPDLEGDELEIDISKPEMGMEVHVQDLSDLTPDEAFGAGWAAAAQAIEDALATGPEEAVEAGDEMGEEDEEDLMEQELTAFGFPKGMKSTSKKDVETALTDVGRAAHEKDFPGGRASEEVRTGGYEGSATRKSRQQAQGTRAAAAAVNRTKARREKMAPGETGSRATPGTEPGDLFKETIDLAEAKKAAKQVFIKLLKKKKVVKENDGSSPLGALLRGAALGGIDNPQDALARTAVQAAIPTLGAAVTANNPFIQQLAKAALLGSIAIDPKTQAIDTVNKLSTPFRTTPHEGGLPFEEVPSVVDIADYVLPEGQILNEDGVNPEGATIVPGGLDARGVPRSPWVKDRFENNKQYKWTPEGLDAFYSSEEGRAEAPRLKSSRPGPGYQADPPESKRKKKRRYAGKTTGTRSRMEQAAEEAGINESLSIEEAKKIAKNIFIRFLKEEEALSGQKINEQDATGDAAAAQNVSDFGRRREDKPRRQRR